ncbi:putative serine/threonine-protein kinase drkD [Dorcoceras hygrometricum]|uniref:Putative serine/threonine-protein kinase drkD n=1 Tax=Dorcoceras hygrometricum TaxID=472368 RepID=A0A2Z7BJL5_9LAMI|nr:putative serine/threonine-protein kinase drkD [Dorcoceras hygrometricum]
MTGRETPSSACTRRPDEISTDGFSSISWPEQIPAREAAAAATSGGRSRTPQNPPPMLNTLSSVSVQESRIQYLCDPQWFRDTASRITDSACKNQLVVVSIQYGPFNPYIPIRSTTIGKSRVAIDPIAIHTSWRSNSDIASVTSLRAVNPRQRCIDSYMHRDLTQSHRLMTPSDYLAGNLCLAPTGFVKKTALHVRWRKISSIRSTIGDGIPSSACTRRTDEIGADGFSSSNLAGNDFPTKRGGGGGGGFWRGEGGGACF